MSNPYQSPQSQPFDAKYFQDAPVLTQGGGEYGWVQQVRVYAVLSAVQGLLELPMGAMLVGVGAMFPVLVKMEPPRGGNPPPDAVLYAMTAMYAGLGSVLLLAAFLRFFAAYRNFYFKGRLLGIASMILGLGSMLSCYCAPTAIAVLVYGLIIYLNPAVKLAFDMGQSGRTPDEIFAAFTPFRTPPPMPQSPFAGPGS
jgi:hypothetical protein